MIKRRTLLMCADNSGATKLQCIGFVGLGNRDFAKIGDIITVSIKEAEPRKAIKKGEVAKAVIVRQRLPIRRKDGSYVRFYENAAVLIKTKNEPVGNRMFGPFPIEIKQKGFEKIASLAPELV